MEATTRPVTDVAVFTGNREKKNGQREEGPNPAPLTGVWSTGQREATQTTQARWSGFKVAESARCVDSKWCTRVVAESPE